MKIDLTYIQFEDDGQNRVVVAEGLWVFFFAFYLKIHGGEEFEVEILKSFRPEVFIIVRGAKGVCFF